MLNIVDDFSATTNDDEKKVEKKSWEGMNRSKFGELQGGHLYADSAIRAKPLMSELPRHCSVLRTPLAPALFHCLFQAPTDSV